MSEVIQGFEQDLKKTPLFEMHNSFRGKMVPFAGYKMPVSYPDGIQSEYFAVRNEVGAFDVSHMGEFFIRGKQAKDFI